MTNKYNFTEKCPSVADYEMYLANIGEKEFMLAFNNHLNNCELCHAAIIGYKEINTIHISNTLHKVTTEFFIQHKPAKQYNFKYLAYAASIMVLLGLSFIYINKNNTLKNNKLSDNIYYDILIESAPNPNKTLVKKDNDQYIYIDNCDKIAYNDQFLSAIELGTLLKKQENTSIITIEVATSNYQCAINIINTIKQQTTAPIITISNTKGLKKLTPWGGDLGG